MHVPTYRTSYSIGFGNAKGGTAFSFSDLATNPIVKVLIWGVHIYLYLSGIIL